MFSSGEYTENYPSGYDDFDKSLPLTVKEVNCKGTSLYFILSDKKDVEYYAFISMGITSRWQNNYDKYCKWFIEIENNVTLWFREPCSFSNLEFFRNKKYLQKKLNSLGPDILKSEFKLPEFKKIAKTYANLEITSFLMDQSIISGCCNYTKSEVLYDAKISPLRKIGTLKDNELDLLYNSLRIIPRISYNNENLRKFSYDNINSYADIFNIYGKSSAKKSSTADGNFTYWDPEVQI